MGSTFRIEIPSRNPETGEDAFLSPMTFVDPTMLDQGTKVVLATVLPEYGLSAGDTGTIMLTYDAGENGEPDYVVAGRDDLVI